MSRTTTTFGAVGLLAIAVTAALLLTHPTATLAPSPADPAATYIAVLDVDMGWPAPSRDARAQEVATGHQICHMLAAGWNEAGVVANMLTWPGNGESTGQLDTVVRVTRDSLCGLGT